MAANDFQNDLFSEQGRDEKEKKNPFLGKYSDQRYLPQVKVPIEYTVVIAIGMLIAVIVAYAFGVERGKRISIELQGDPGAKHSVLEEEDKPLLDVALVEKQAEELMKKADAPPEPETSETKGNTPLPRDAAGKQLQVKQSDKPAVGDTLPASQANGSIYSLQLASTKNEEYAKVEIAKLKSKGFQASVVNKGGWFKVYIPYSTAAEAEKAKKKLMADYKDCLIVKSKPQAASGL